MTMDFKYDGYVSLEHITFQAGMAVKAATLLVTVSGNKHKKVIVKCVNIWYDNNERKAVSLCIN